MNKKGQILSLVVFALLFLGTIAITTITVFGTGTYQTADFIDSSQALGITLAGKHWALEQLENLSNWSSISGTFSQNLSPGSFSVTATNATNTSLDFSVVGQIQKPDGAIIQRTMSATAWKLPGAFNFALYRGGNSGTLDIRNSTSITGNVYSGGSINFRNGTTAQGGKVYHPSGYSVTGAGDYLAESLSAPVPAVGAPSFTNTYYSGIIANYNSLIALAPPSVQLNINSDYVVDGDVYCSNLSVTGTVTISGKGRIICTGWARMPNGNGRVTIAPDSTIEIISANIIYMYCSNSNRRCTIKGNVTLYSQYYVYGYGRYCIIDNSTIMIDRHPSLTSLYVFFYNGATVTNSLIYASSSSRGVVIGGNNTVVGNTILNEGTYMYVYNRGTFNGLIYHNNSTASARAYIYTGTINGSLVRTHDFFSSYIRSSIINFNADLLPDPPPQGFENVVTLKPYSWNGW